MKKNIILEIINSLQTTTTCPNCHGSYAKEDIRILADADNICFVQLDCQKCMSPIVATVFVNSVNDMNISKDANKISKYYGDDIDARKYEYDSLGPISGDDILAIYHKIKSN